jgi:death-on-curing protein
VSSDAELIYLELDDILELYAAIIGATSTQAADHLRDRSALESALARPATHAHYEDADLILQAAVLAHGIAETQLFVDGNKRIALVAMLTFLEINGQSVTASEHELADWILSLSRGATPKELAERVKERCGTF